MFLSYRNQPVDLLYKSTDWFLYEGALAVKGLTHILAVKVARDNCKNSENRNLFSKFDFMLAKFVLNIFRLRFSFLATYFLISACCLLLNKKLGKDGKAWLNFALHCRYFLSYSNSVFNSLIFLKMR